MAGGAKVEVLAFGEVDFETDKNLIHFRHSKGDSVSGPGFFTLPIVRSKPATHCRRQTS
jgi:hypothetical protein